jgi:hypothetical protein
MEKKSVYSIIQSEVAYLQDYELGFDTEPDVIVAIRSILTQTYQCYISSGPVHAMHLLRHLGGFVQYYFNVHNFAQQTRPYAEQPSFGCWLIILDKIIGQCEDSVARGAVGDVRSHFMTILSVVLGAMEQHGGEMRQGYEDGVAKGVTR